MKQPHFCLQSDDDFETLPGSIGLERANGGVGKWSKGMVAPRSLNVNANRGNLISVGPDGRGGKVKVLRDHGRFQVSSTSCTHVPCQGQNSLTLYSLIII